MRITLAMAAAFAKYSGATLNRGEETVTFTLGQLRKYTVAVAGAALLPEPETRLDDAETVTH